MRRSVLSASILLLTAALAGAALKPGDFVTRGPQTAKRIALTFDDGPGPHTDEYLALLDRYGAKATFFMLAEQVKHRPKTAKEVRARGHEIASHTYNHVNYLKRYRANAAEGEERAVEKTRAELVADMNKSRQIIEEATGAKLRLLRMPHGVDRPWVKEAAKATGFILANWTYGGDWVSRPEPELELSYLKAIKPGAILLLHDGGSRREKSLRLTEAVLKAARDEGYEIVVLSELLGL